MRPTNDLLRLALLLLLLVWAGQRAARLELDVENRSMRSSGEAQVRAEALREQLFGPGATLVLLLQPEEGRTAPAAQELDQWATALRECAQVEGGFSLDPKRAQERLLALNLKPDPEGNAGPSLQLVVDLARRSLPAGTQLFVSGSPAGEAAISNALDREQRRIIPTVAVVLFLLLLAVYRSPSLALGTLLPAIGGIALTGALQEACAIAINPVTALLPPVLLAVGVAGCVHLLDAYLEQRAAGADPNRASREAQRLVLTPALACAATTVIGFVALCASPVPAIRRFGLLAAAGVVFTVLLSFSLLPIWLRLFARSPALVRRAPEQGRWRSWVDPIVRQLEAKAKWLAVGSAIAALLLGWAWTHLRIDTDPLRILPEQHAFRIATAEIGARLGGTETFDLLLEAPGPSGMLALLALQARVLAIEGVAGPAGVPRRSADGTALISVLLKPAGTTAREQVFEQAETLGNEQGWRRVQAIGAAVRVARDSGAIGRGEIYGLIATLLALGPCIWLGLRSLRLTLLGMAANALPCLMLHGGLALAGRPLSVGSAMIGSVILGIVVDDAIYFLHVFRAQSATRASAPAIVLTLRSSGRAMTVTSLVLALGFLVGALGELSTTREFAWLASGAILAAWAANLFLLPAFLLVPGRARRASA